MMRKLLKLSGFMLNFSDSFVKMDKNQDKTTPSNVTSVVLIIFQC